MRLPLQARDHRATVLVTALSSGFGVALLGLVSSIDQVTRAQSPGLAASADGSLVLAVLALVFLGLSVYVGALVTANTFSTIVAARTRTIALLRLLGDTAAAQRRALVREGAVVGAVGAVAGAALGLGTSVLVLRVLVARGDAPDVAYSYVGGGMVLPPVAVVAATVLAAWSGSRGVGAVSPVAALDASQEASTPEVRRRVARTVLGALALLAGAALLVAGVGIGAIDPTGVLVAFVGGVLSFSGVVALSHVVVPPALRLVGTLLGRSAPARLARATTRQHPERSARSAVGLVIGVTLVTTFGTALQTLVAGLDAFAGPTSDEAFGGTLAVFSVLVGFSAVVAAVGMVNDLSLGVLQRRRELGLLRALGLTAGQVRHMVLAEAAQLAVTAVVLGTVLGVVYGWAGAQSVLGSATHSLIVPEVPPVLLGALVVVTALLTVVASLAPTRTATRVSPVEALRVA